MFGTIRKHQKWLWVIIITFTVISFVVYFNPSSRYGEHMRAGDLGRIGGQKITIEKFMAAQREVYLRYFAATGDWPDKDAREEGFDVERETFYRLLLLHKIKELGIAVDSSVVVRVANDMLRAFGGGNPVPLDVFVSRKLAERGLTAEDFERFVRNEVAVQELVALVGGAGRLVTPEEARAVYARENQELSAQVVAFLAVNYLTEVNVSTQAVTQFFTNQMARYRLPERVQVHYVAFPVSNHLAEAEAELTRTNLDALVNAEFERLGTNYVRVADTPEAARARIREVLVKNAALQKARRVANAFATELFERQPVRPDNLATLASEKGLTVQLTEPFDREDGPKEFSAPATLIQTAFKLSADSPFSGPLPTQDAVYVLAFHRRLPSEVPSLDSIWAKVANDCRYEQAVLLARQAGRSFLATLTNGLAQGRSFGELCTAANLKPVLLPPFSLSTRSLPEVEQDLPLTQFKQIAFQTPVGQVSDLVPTRDGALIVHVKDRLPLDEARMKENLPRFTAYLRQVRQQEAFNDWFRKQADEGLRETALALARPQPGLQTGGSR